MSAPITSVEAVRTFVLAGKAKITLKSLATQTRFTYQVSQVRDSETGKPKAGWFFVGLLTGSDNESNYQYIGLLRDNQFAVTKRSKISADAPGSRAFAFFVKNLFEANRVHAQMEIWHEGSCGRCGRALTVPESIERGIGPECASKMGLDHRAHGLERGIPGDDDTTTLLMAA